MDKAAETFQQQAEAYGGPFDHLLLGGDRHTLLAFRKRCAYLERLESIRLPRILNVDDPKLDTLRTLPRLIYTSRVITSAPLAPAPSSHRLELRRLLGAAGGVARAVGVRAGARKAASLHDQVLLPDRPSVQPALEDFADSRGVPCLRGERRPGRVRRHGVVGHRPPWVVVGSGLREPDVAGVSRELSALQRPER